MAKGSIKGVWDCGKGRHEPLWSEADGFFRCKGCGLPLDARRRAAEEARLVREGVLCRYCEGRDGLHRVIQRADGVCIACSGGDVFFLSRLLERAVLKLGEETELGMEIESNLRLLNENRERILKGG